MQNHFYWKAGSSWRNIQRTRCESFDRYLHTISGRHRDKNAYLYVHRHWPLLRQCTPQYYRTCFPGFLRAVRILQISGMEKHTPPCTSTASAGWQKIWIMEQRSLPHIISGITASRKSTVIRHRVSSIRHLFISGTKSWIWRNHIHQGLCPPAWHVPTENDWKQLFTVFQGNGFAANPLKATGFSGYNALLNGVDFFNKTFRFDGFATLFWSSTSWGSFKAWSHGMNTYNYSVSYYPSFRTNAFPVRCIHDWG